jgi:hypothetical protein
VIVAGTPLKVTLLASWRLLPSMVTTVPGAPDRGLNRVMTGAGAEPVSINVLALAEGKPYSSPTAIQPVGPVHDAALRKFSASFLYLEGLGVTDQVVPFHDSIRVWFVWFFPP